MIPGVALWLPSGYSWGAVALVLCAIACAPRWLHHESGSATRRLAWLIGAMGVLWSIEIEPQPGVTSPELLLKYLAALPCLWFAVAAPPRPAALWAGLALGGVGSGLLALIQVYGLGLERAHGFTNAIQYGDLSLLIGLMALSVMAVLWARLSGAQRAGLGAGGTLGLIGSMLSQSRGGWLTLALLAPVLLLLLLRYGQPRSARKLGLAITATVVLAAAPLHGELATRLASVGAETQAYLQQQDAESSIGQRLAHWQLALSLGADRPLLGWGSAYNEEKARRVQARQAATVTLGFDHAHNELLDMFARRGLVGVALLLLYLWIPLRLFWPAASRRGSAAGATLDPERLALRITGILLPLGYLGFGFTQVLFAHNSGHMFYLFMLIAIHATLSSCEHAEETPDRPRQPTHQTDKLQLADQPNKKNRHRDGGQKDFSFWRELVTPFLPARTSCDSNLPTLCESSVGSVRLAALQRHQMQTNRHFSRGCNEAAKSRTCSNAQRRVCTHRQTTATSGGRKH